MVWKIRDLIAKAGRSVVGCSSSVALQIASSVISLAVAVAIRAFLCTVTGNKFRLTI